MNLRLVMWSCALVLAACTAPAESVRDRAAGVDGAVSAADAALVKDAADELELGTLRSEREPRLRLWTDADFRRRFAESYLAETEIEPGVSLAEREVLIAAIDLLQEDELDAAQRLLERKLSPGSSAVFDFTLAQIHFQRDELPRAAELYQAAIDKHPKFRRAWQALGQIRFKLGAFPDAAVAMTRVLELGGGDAVTYGLLGIAQSRLEQHLAAESAFRFASMLAPESLDWKLGMAESFFKQERFGEAIALFGRLVVERPDRADFWLAQGEAYARIGESLKAAENFEMADRLGGAGLTVLQNLGDIYANESLFDLAVNAYLRALEREPAASVERFVRAAKFMTANGALQSTSRLLDGLEAERGEDLDDEVRKDMLKMRARIAVAEGSGEDEVAILRQIVDLDPLDGDALILLGQYHGRNGNPEQAVFYFERAAGIESFEADAKIRHAQLLVGQGKYQEALPLLRRAQDLAPRDNIRQFLEQVERVALKR